MRLAILLLPACTLGLQTTKNTSDTGAVAEYCAEDAPGTRRLRRLTHAEHAATVAALLGTAVDPDGFAEDEVVEGFDNNAEALVVSSLLADQYMRAAEAAAEAADLDALLPCGPDDGDWAGCAIGSIVDIGRSAFRRPLTDDEVERYYRLWETVAAEEGFDVGVQWVLAAMLQSPHFLYRAELGARGDSGDFVLSDYEIVSELSFLLWGQAPDDALLDRADAGGLADASARRALAEEMLADPRAEQALPQFVRQWLGLEQLRHVTRDDTLTPTLREEMLSETDRMVAAVARDGGGLEALLTWPETYVTPALAAHYDLTLGDDEADADGFVAVEAAEGGLLAQGSVMASHALPTSSSPIHRGALIRERLLCQPLAPPPPDLDTTPPEVDPDLSTRERYAQHAADPACKGCHDLIDPIGFGMEHYDSVGRWRAADGGHPIDASGEVLYSPDADGVFDGVPGLSARLSGSAHAEACLTEMLLTHSLGTTAAEEVGCLTGWMAADESAQSLEGRLLALVGAETFANRTGGADEGDAPMGGPGAGGDLEPSIDVEAAAEPDLEVAVETSEWNSTYCQNVTVTNVSDTALRWSVTIDVFGPITSSWNADHEDTEGTVAFSGVEWNQDIEPGGTASFGYCGNH